MTTIISAIIGFILCFIIICLVVFIMLGVVGLIIDYKEDPEDTDA